MAKFWPLHHYNQCMGENRRKSLSTTLHNLWERGLVNLIFFTKYRVGCELSYETCPISLCALIVTLVIQGGAMAIAPLQSMYGRE